MNWFKPTEAQQLLRVATDRGLVRVEGGQVTPTFEISEIEAPMNYRPTPSILEVPPAEPDVFTECVDRIATATGTDRRGAVAGVNAIQERMDVEIEVAALIYAAKLGIDISNLLDRTDAVIRRRRPR